MLTISIVSHAHGAMVERLIRALLSCASVAQIIVTKNVQETLAIPPSTCVHIIANETPKGFGANHNAAFRVCNQPYFCPLNPDIEFNGDVFVKLIRALESFPLAALAAPLILAPNGDIADSIRRFPSVRGLFRKALGKDNSHYSVTPGAPDFFPEWTAGMFMVFRSAAYEKLCGFDERFFMYYEDVDICARAWSAGLKVVACPSVSVVHDARRDSHKNLKYLRWHLVSMARYFMKYRSQLPHVY